MPANELVEIKVSASLTLSVHLEDTLQERDDSKYNVILHKATCTTYNFSCRAKLDEYNVRPNYHLCSLSSDKLGRTVGAKSYTLRDLKDQSFELQRGGDSFTGFAPFCLGTVRQRAHIHSRTTAFIVTVYISASSFAIVWLSCHCTNLETFWRERRPWWRQLSSSGRRIRRSLSILLHAVCIIILSKISFA